MDPRTPVIVGAGQASQRPDAPAPAREPIALLVDAAHAADADAGAVRSVLAALDTVAVVDIVSWTYPDPGALLGRRLGVEPRSTMTTTVGGNSPQLLVNELSSEIAQGHARAVPIDVAQSAALLLCSYELARDLGVPDERLVFPLAGADAHDRFFFSERESLTASPAIAVAGGSALDAAGAGIDDVDRFDLYSCFPSAVELALGALDLRGPRGGDPRPLTVTGGLGFAGGPANDYPMHAIAAMVDACRQDPGSIGMVSALGWYVTKHSIGLYSTTPPEHGFTRVDTANTQATVDALPGRPPAGAYSGPATVEAAAVVFEREGAPASAILSTITPDGRRALAH